MPEGQRYERKNFITVAEWGSGNSQSRTILGTRTTSASMDLNADVEKTTDIRGINYADINKTQPEMTFDPSYILAGDDLSEYLYKAALENDISKYNGVFTVYQIAAWDGDSTNGYYAVKHTGCSIIPDSIGGEAWLEMPFTVHFSNDITIGTVNKITDDFTFTASASVGG